MEAGAADWAALRTAADGVAASPSPAAADGPRLARAVPVLFVRDVAAAAAFYAARLGFRAEFLHGEPPFYGSMARDGACLHLRHVGAPNSPNWRCARIN